MTMILKLIEGLLRISDESQGRDVKLLNSDLIRIYITLQSVQ